MAATLPAKPIPTALSTPSRALVIIAWAVMFLASGLPVILINEITGSKTIGGSIWVFWARLAFLLVLALVATFNPTIRPLRNFFLILSAVYIIEKFIFDFLGKTSSWTAIFGTGSAPFTTDMLGTQLLRLFVALLIILVLVLLRYRRQQFFLVKGDLSAPIEPVRWLGFPKADPWTRFGGQFAAYITLGTLAFLFIAARPQLSTLLQAIPMFPAILLFASMNAFNEEMTYRASFLATLENAIGPRHALWIAALFFGIGHYYGIPYGVVGVILASFLGFMLGKAMLETRGFFWAWFIHFLQDVAIFTFLAVSSITPGG